MSLLVIGLNHITAAIEMRERVAFSPEQIPEALLRALDGTGLVEAIILSTCNRTELIAAAPADGDAEERALDWFATVHHLSRAQLDGSLYRHRDAAAMRHLIEVASGLDSMVLGEPQIFGQLKSAYSAARHAGTVRSELSRVVSHVFTVAKKVRTETAIGENPVSVAFAAVKLARHIFSDLAATTALLIGAGETIELVARHLSEQDDPVNPRDAVDDRLALADRFGLSIGFHNCSQDDFLAIVAGYAVHFGLDWQETEALEWSKRRGARSGRVAWQFVTELAGRAGMTI